MARRILFSFVLAVLVQSAVVNAQRREVFGSVRDASGAVIPGVTVELLRDGQVVETTTTNEDGEFALPIDFSAVKVYEIRVTSAGFSPGSVRVDDETRSLSTRAGLFQLDVRVRSLPTAAPRPPPPPPPPVPSDSHAIVPVFYATDRERLRYQPLTYGPKRNPMERLHLGRFDVSIPRDAHHIGQIERPSIWTFWREDPNKHFVIVQRVQHTYADFYTEVLRIVEKSAQRQVIVFIHGYNVAFDDAVYRTAQLAYDLGFDGAPILYSWPSEATLHGYPIDANNADWTVPHLRWFLEDVATKTQAHVVHVIAHSMGNRPLVAAMNRIAVESAPDVKSRFSQIVLTAPDIDASTFRGLASALRGAAQRVTLYASSNDLALKASQRFQGYQRAGDTQPNVVLVDGIDTIDVSAVETGFLGHSYYGDRRSVLTDLFYLIRDGLGPERRAGLAPAGQPPSRYWVFRP